MGIDHNIHSTTILGKTVPSIEGVTSLCSCVKMQDQNDPSYWVFDTKGVLCALSILFANYTALRLICERIGSSSEVWFHPKFSAFLFRL